MVLDWLRRGGSDDGMTEVARQTRSMLSDARHSFDLAMSALVAGADPAAVVEDVRSTDRRINDTEQDVRRRLLVHSTVQGSSDIDTVLAYLMLSRKVERVGDQAKNILDLALEGVDLSAASDIDDLRRWRDDVSRAFEQAQGIITDPRDDEAEAFRTQMSAMSRECESRLRELLHSDEPAQSAVPRALLFRYLKRTVANLGGIASALTDPFDLIDYSTVDDESADVDD
ncbi:MAG: PhoU domain-containing protein [Acidimicrobiales bacterium]|nr:PhoU domain-containing protein [Acidimicrobiales bacterium]